MLGDVECGVLVHGFGSLLDGLVLNKSLLDTDGFVLGLFPLDATSSFSVDRRRLIRRVKPIVTREDNSPVREATLMAMQGFD